MVVWANKISINGKSYFRWNKISARINKFKKFLFQKQIHYPSNGIIFFSDATSYKSINYVIKCIETGLKKYFVYE